MPMDVAALVELGESLGRRRRLNGLAVREVGAKLLLSDQQVRDLESGADRSFHNRGFYLRALRRYAVFSDVSADEVDRVFNPVDAAGVTASRPKDVWSLSALLPPIAELLQRWRRHESGSRHSTSGPS